ncbi:MAG: ATP-binding cassette domain-containing protein, partial [Alphaproteobacteria bacterium]
AYGGAAGALHATSLGVLSPEVFDFSIMVACLTMAVVGGRGRIAGAILGAVLLVHLPEWLRGLEQYYLIAYGAALLLVVILTPDGLAGLVDRFWPRGREPGEILPFVPASVRGSRAGGATLHVEDLAKSFGGVAALDGVSLRVAPGEIVGLIGPNGSGKSTLANLITGVYRPDRGRIRLDATPLETLRPHEIARLGVRRTFQTAELIAGASLIDNVAVAYAAAANPSLPHARSRALTVLSGAGLTARARKDAAAQPAGVRRLAEVARATVRGPRLLVLDEPSAGLTEDERTTLTRLLRDLAGQGAAILVIDHNVPFLSGLAGRLVCLETGRVIADGTPDVVLADAAVRRAYLGTAEKKP